MNAPLITLAANAVADPTLRFTGNGTPVANLRVASSERRQEGGSWVDGPTTFLTVTVWNAMAEHVAESVSKGDRLLVHGRLSGRDYEHDGEQRTSYEITADEIAVSLRYANVAPSKTGRGSSDRPESSQAAGGDWPA